MTQDFVKLRIADLVEAELSHACTGRVLIHGRPTQVRRIRVDLEVGNPPRVDVEFLPHPRDAQAV